MIFDEFEFYPKEYQDKIFFHFDKSKWAIITSSRIGPMKINKDFRVYWEQQIEGFNVVTIDIKKIKTLKKLANI